MKANTDEQSQLIALTEVGFLRKFIRHMAGILEEVVGLQEASGFISTIAQRLGEQLNVSYKQAIGVNRLDHKQTTRVIADLQNRIKGRFKISHESSEKVVFTTCLCPFDKDVIDRPSMCMMSSNIIGVIYAENLGYAKVSIEESISQGDCGCKVVIYLKNTDEAKASEGREYYQS